MPPGASVFPRCNDPRRGDCREPICSVHSTPPLPPSRHWLPHSPVESYKAAVHVLVYSLFINTLPSQHPLLGLQMVETGFLEQTPGPCWEWAPRLQNADCNELRPTASRNIDVLHTEHKAMFQPCFPPPPTAPHPTPSTAPYSRLETEEKQGSAEGARDRSSDMQPGIFLTTRAPERDPE
ncbi:unnamed protein product [Gadus morhua 'NCC']